MTAQAEAAAFCAAEAKRFAYDDYIASLFARPAARPGLQALAAFAETTRLAALGAREKMAGAIRVAWWREALRGEREGEAAANPVACILRGAVRDLPGASVEIEAMLDARLIELGGEPFGDDLAVAAYADRAEGARLRLIALMLGAPADALAARAVGLARVEVRWLLSGARAASVEEAVDPNLAAAEAAVRAADGALMGLGRAGRSAFLAYAATQADFAAFRRSGVAATRLRRLSAVFWMARFRALGAAAAQT